MISSRPHPVLDAFPHAYSTRSLVPKTQRDSWIVLSPQARANINQRVLGLSPRDSVELADFRTARFNENPSPRQDGVGRRLYVTPKLKKQTFRWHLTAKKPIQGSNTRVGEQVPVATGLRTEQPIQILSDRSVEVSPENKPVKLPNIARLPQGARAACPHPRKVHPVGSTVMAVFTAAGMTPEAWTPEPSYSNN